jgi:hypothetical protein
LAPSAAIRDRVRAMPVAMAAMFVFLAGPDRVLRYLRLLVVAA